MADTAPIDKIDGYRDEYGVRIPRGLLYGPDSKPLIYVKPSDSTVHSASGVYAPLVISRMDATTPGTTNKFEASLYTRRLGVTLYRTGVSMPSTGTIGPDVLATPAAPTAADVATGGVFLAATTYKIATASENLNGVTSGSATASVVTASDASNTHVMRVTVAQVTGATKYNIFASTATNPLWVGVITEAQRAAGGFAITAVGTTAAGGGAAAGQVDVQVIGTGVASNAAPFTSTANAVVLPAATISAAGYTWLYIYTVPILNDNRASVGTATIIPYFKNDVTGNYHRTGSTSPVVSITPGSAGASIGYLSTATPLEVDGCANIKLVWTALGTALASGQTLSMDIYYDLA